jgi:hypothetical protein
MQQSITAITRTKTAVKTMQPEVVASLALIRAEMAIQLAPKPTVAGLACRPSTQGPSDLRGLNVCRSRIRRCVVVAVDAVGGKTFIFFARDTVVISAVIRKERKRRCIRMFRD